MIRDDNTRAVPFVPFRCWRCGGVRPQTYGQEGRVRYHKCRQCGTKYRSVEMTPEEARRFEMPSSQPLVPPPSALSN